MSRKPPVFRDLKRMTEILILLEFLENPGATLTEVGKKIGISKQAVFEYIKRMIAEGTFLEKTGTDGNYRVTFEGIEALQSSTVEIESFAKEASEKLQLIRVITAIAGNNIKKGESLGLFMENGTVVAYTKKKSSSTGTSLHDAARGEDVKVGSLKGIIDHEIAPMIVVKVPERSSNCDFEKLERIFEENKDSKIAVLDLVARVAVEKTNNTIDIQFAALESTIDASTKGITVTVVGTESSVDELMRKLASEYPSLSKKMIGQTVECAKK